MTHKEFLSARKQRGWTQEKTARKLKCDRRTVQRYESGETKVIPDEVVKVIQSCKTEREKLLVLCLIDSTCRIGELAGLRCDKVGMSWIDVLGKTGERRYRLDAVLCRELLSYSVGRDYVFANIDGSRLTSKALGIAVRRVVIRAGLVGVKLGPHTLRHSMASLVARETGSV